jgi:hypothetical protein
MNRDYSQQRHHRDASRFNEPDRYGGGRSSRYGNPSRYEDSASNWNDEQTARWLSHYGGASQRGERDYDIDYDRNEYAQGYGDRRSSENPRYGQRFQETWEGSSPDEAWRQRGAERVSPGSHGRYGWRSEDVEQGALNFQPGERGYGSAYGPTFGSTYRHPERGYENYPSDWPSPAGWSDESRYHTDERSGTYHGRGPSGYTRSDERIREDVCDRLTDDPHVDASSIQVTVESGVVTLQGQVFERPMKHRAEDCAEHVSGVKDVENRLRVSRGDAWSEEGEGGGSLLRHE